MAIDFEYRVGVLEPQCTHMHLTKLQVVGLDEIRWQPPLSFMNAAVMSSSVDIMGCVFVYNV